MTDNLAKDRPAETEQMGIWARLKSGTRGMHERLDHRVMAGRPFESRERYGMFLLMQHGFHEIVSPLYRHAALSSLLSGLSDRDRVQAIEQDLHDLGIAVPERAPANADYEIDIPNALGWIYVSEGSNLGAAFLLKAAKQIGLSETFGARHLAAAPEGRGLHWKTFTSALDAYELSAAEEARVIAGANEAFAKVLGLAELRLFGPMAATAP